ncbi:MAG: hypothetical protein DMF82_15940 [Acidobacteria bacterium]|nr:MAG: hypothetical protein DMF82_15940 [Acidobacteriota bacterium]
MAARLVDELHRPGQAGRQRFELLAGREGGPRHRQHVDLGREALQGAGRLQRQALRIAAAEAQ